MKAINRQIVLTICGMLVFICLVNLYLSKKQVDYVGREYRIAINRIEQVLPEVEQEKGRAPKSLEELMEFTRNESYPYLVGLSAISIEHSSQEEIARFLMEEKEDYVIFATKEYYYRITYRSQGTVSQKLYILINGVMISLCLMALALLLYIRKKILLPFYQLSELPYSLSKGNLTIPLQENKNRFFGKFVWGMDLLREKLEENKEKELSLQKEKKLLLLSLSHDIKTPLSAIKLYAKALSRNLYKEEAKKVEIAENINRKVDEIEEYISEIVTASNEDFLHFEVKNGEFYLADALEKIREYYLEKMALNQIAFYLGEYRNCLVFGDEDRFIEVVQNVIENAIKYGDGKKIWLEMEKKDEEYEIRILNTGCQLEEKELPHIFDSFFRGSNVEKNKGSGLGLYICRELMHLMEGEIMAGITKVEEERVMLVRIILHLV